MSEHKHKLLKWISAVLLVFLQLLYSNQYITSSMKTSIKSLLNYEEVAMNIDDEIEKAEFYSAVASEIMDKTVQLQTVYSNKFQSYEIEIEQICSRNNLVNISLELPDKFQIRYEYKTVKVSEKTIKKQFHYKQAKVLKNQFIKGYKQYREIESRYKKRIQELDEEILILDSQKNQTVSTEEVYRDKTVRDLPVFFKSYVWPCNSGEYITGVFGEFRERRFHSGMDVRTFGKIGFEVYAIENGYLERMRTGSKGYGKALYIRLDDGNIAVYAHLSSFKSSFNQIAKFIQNSENRYTIDKSFDPFEYPVKKGELIGYTGDTGGLSGPHLHFEIRDESNHPLNPFLTNLGVTDSQFPIPKSLAIIPTEKQSLINGFPKTKILEILKINERNFQVPDTISIQGQFGIALQINDRINKHSFNFGLYGINLFIDDELIYKTQFSIYDFEENNSFYEHLDYTLFREGNGKYYRLQSDENPMSFVDESSKPIPKLIDGYHSYRIEAWDFAQNLVTITGVLKVAPIPEITVSFHNANNQITVTTNSDESIKPSITLLTLFDDNHSLYPKITTNNGGVSFENPNHPFKVIEVVGDAPNGLRSKPQYFGMNSKTILYPEVTPKIKHYPHGIILEFYEEIFTNRTADLLLGNFRTLQKYSLERSNKNVFSSQVFSPEELSEFTEFSIRYLGEPDVVVKSNIHSQLVIPNRSFQLSFDSETISVSGDGDTFQDTTLVWINNAFPPQLPEGEIIAGPYFIGPDLVPYSDEIDITFNLDLGISKFENSGIFYFDTRKSKWHYMVTEKSGNSYSTTALSGEIFALIAEDNSPKLIDLIPDVGGTYKDLTSLSLFVRDSFSGVDGENNVTVKIDGQKIIHEYISYRKLINYQFDEELSKGTHQLTIEAQDNVGNTTIITGDFFVQ